MTGGATVKVCKQIENDFYRLYMGLLAALERQYIRLKTTNDVMIIILLKKLMSIQVTSDL